MESQSESRSEIGSTAWIAAIFAFCLTAMGGFIIGHSYGKKERDASPNWIPQSPECQWVIMTNRTAAASVCLKHSHVRGIVMNPAHFYPGNVIPPIPNNRDERSDGGQLIGKDRTNSTDGQTNRGEQ